MALKSVSVGSKRGEDADVFPNSAEDDGSGRYAAAVGSGTMPVSEVTPAFLLSFWKFFGCRISGSYSNHNRSHSS